eukprot:3668190-Prymnesium_polylepis.2
MNYQVESLGQLVHVGSWTHDADPPITWFTGTWRNVSGTQFIFSSGVGIDQKPMELMPPPLPPPPAFPPSPQAIGASDVTLIVVLTVLGATSVMAIFTVVLKHKCWRLYAKIRHILHLPRIWCA